MLHKIDPDKIEYLVQGDLITVALTCTCGAMKLGLASRDRTTALINAANEMIYHATLQTAIEYA